jgi:hypothetical protein
MTNMLRPGSETLRQEQQIQTFSNSRRMGLMKVADTCCAASCPNSMARAISGTCNGRFTRRSQASHMTQLPVSALSLGNSSTNATPSAIATQV